MLHHPGQPPTTALSPTAQSLSHQEEQQAHSWGGTAQQKSILGEKKCLVLASFKELPVLDAASAPPGPGHTPCELLGLGQRWMRDAAPGKADDVTSSTRWHVLCWEVTAQLLGVLCARLPQAQEKAASK